MSAPTAPWSARTPATRVSSPSKSPLDPEEYKRRLRAKDRTEDGEDQDPGNRAVNFRGEKRSNATPGRTTTPDGRFGPKGSSATARNPAYTATPLMRSRHRFFLALGANISKG